MKSYLLIHIIPTVFATIDIYLSGSFHTNFTAKVSGSDKSIITESERISFNITDGIVKDCVSEFLGGRPNDVFIHGPTPWGDLYKRYGWIETYRILTPVSSRIVNIASTPQMLKQIITTNRTGITIPQTIYSRFSNIWIKTPDLSVKKINKHIDVDNFKMSYETAFGVNEVKLQAMTTGVNLTEVLDIGAIVELYAMSVSIRTLVLYQASLWGNFVLNYDRRFRGHHFYSPNLEDIMLNCGLNNILEVKEFIDVGFYTDAKVVVKNKSNGLTLLTQNLEIYTL